MRGVFIKTPNFFIVSYLFYNVNRKSQSFDWLFGIICGLYFFRSVFLMLGYFFVDDK